MQLMVVTAIHRTLQHTHVYTYTHISTRTYTQPPPLPPLPASCHHHLPDSAVSPTHYDVVSTGMPGEGEDTPLLSVETSEGMDTITSDVIETNLREREGKLKSTDRQTHTQRDTHTHIHTYTHTDTHTHTDRQTDTHTDRHTHRQTHTQTDTHRHTLTCPSSHPAASTVFSWLMSMHHTTPPWELRELRGLSFRRSHSDM